MVMDIFQIDAQGQLFIAPDIDDWQPVTAHGITAVFDLDSDLDIGVPAVPNQLLYIYFPFEDKELPDLHRLHALAQLGAGLMRQGHRVLSHCGMGHNRSALLAGLILTDLGMPGADAVALLRQKRQGALYNKIYASYVQGLPQGQTPGADAAWLSGGRSLAHAGHCGSA
jgi:protein-tyrosine phosphatase